jgi:hypothetical protein
VVDRLGEDSDWGVFSGWGEVRFSNVELPAGTFTVTISYVFNEMAGSDTSRTGRLRLDPVDSTTNIDHVHVYPRATSVQTWTTPSFNLAAPTTFTIIFTTPSVSGPDRAPALDRIVIQEQ